VGEMENEAKYFLHVTRSSDDGKHSVFFSGPIDEEEGGQLEMDGNKIISSYPIEGSLVALPIIVFDSLEGEGDGFGCLLEKLLSGVAEDLYRKGYGEGFDDRDEEVEER